MVPAALGGKVLESETYCGILGTRYQPRTFSVQCIIPIPIYYTPIRLAQSENRRDKKYTFYFINMHVRSMKANAMDNNQLTVFTKMFWNVGHFNKNVQHSH